MKYVCLRKLSEWLIVRCKLTVIEWNKLGAVMVPFCYASVSLLFLRSDRLHCQKKKKRFHRARSF